MTTNTEQLDLSKRGLDGLCKLAPTDAVICPVVFTPKGVEPSITVPVEYLTEEFLGGCGVNGALPTPHFQIDLVELFR